MSKAFKCDLCGKYYAPYNSPDDVWNTIDLVRRTCYDDFNRIHRCDICPDCKATIETCINDIMERNEKE